MPGSSSCEQIELGGWERQHDADHAGIGREVVAHDECIEDRGILLALDVLKEAVLAAKHLSVAHAEKHGHCVVAVTGKADHVRITAAQNLDRGALLELFQPAQRIAVLARMLEILPLRGDCHQFPDTQANVLGPSLQEREHLLDHSTVILLGLPSDAWRLAPPDVIVQAGPLAPLPGQVVAAAAHGVDPPHDRQSATQLGHIGEWTEVARAGQVAAAGHQHARERLSDGDRDRGIALVVLQPDVEAGAVFLDEVVLEQQGLRLGGCHHGLDIGNEAAKQDVLGGSNGITGEVAAHTRAQALRLADVKHLTLRILPQIHARTIGQCLELALQCVRPCLAARPILHRHA